jgi:hypothetical protein
MINRDLVVIALHDLDAVEYIMKAAFMYLVKPAHLFPQYGRIGTVGITVVYIKGQIRKLAKTMVQAYQFPHLIARWFLLRLKRFAGADDHK